MDVLSTFELSDKYSISLSRRNKPVHFGSSLDFLYCIIFRQISAAARLEDVREMLNLEDDEPIPAELIETSQ